MEKDVQSQIQELEERIRQLRSSQLEELQAKLAEARATVAALEAEIAEITGSPAPSVRSAKTPAADGRRKRTSSEEVKGRILKALSETPEGLSQKEIADLTELNYNTVAVYLKNNSKDFKTTGTLRSKRYFLR